MVIEHVWIWEEKSCNRIPPNILGIALDEAVDKLAGLLGAGTLGSDPMNNGMSGNQMSEEHWKQRHDDVSMLLCYFDE